MRIRPFPDFGGRSELWRGEYLGTPVVISAVHDEEGRYIEIDVAGLGLTQFLGDRDDLLDGLTTALGRMTVLFIKALPVRKEGE